MEPASSHWSPGASAHHDSVKREAMNELASSEESADQQVSRRRVAIIGSGPGGLVAARYSNSGPCVGVADRDREVIAKATHTSRRGSAMPGRR
jgi:NADPH-dependent glutamate synthase beta subunit-like oxidoreductase